MYYLKFIIKRRVASQVEVALNFITNTLKQNKQFVTQSEMKLVTAKVSEISVYIASLTDKQRKA